MLFIGKDGAPQGNFTHKQQRWDFESSTLPAWLVKGNEANGTWTHGIDAGGEHLLMAPDSGKGMYLDSATAYPTAGMKMMKATWHFALVSSVQTLTASGRFVHRDDTTDSHILSWGRHLSGYPNTTWRKRIGSDATYLHTHMPRLTNGVWYDLSMWVDFTDGMMYAGRANQPWEEFDASDVLGSIDTLNPSLWIQSTAGAPTVKVYRVQIDRWY